MRSFLVPFCFKKGRHDKGSKGFYFVETCRLVVDDQTAKIYIYEEDDYQNNALSVKPAAATFDLQSPHLSILFKKTKSRNRNFCAGCVVFSGMADLPKINEISLEMELEKYEELKQLLMRISENK